MKTKERKKKQLFVKLLLFALLLGAPLIVSAQVAISESNFPDEKFRNRVHRYDGNKDGLLTQEEINYITYLHLGGSNIRNLKGIEYFNALRELDCSNNQLISLDVSGCAALADLNCSNNQLITLDVAGCAALKELNCSNNQLITLDVAGCKALTNLDCYGNLLTALDISGCTMLENLGCTYNQLTTLDVSECTALRWIACAYNQLTTLDVSKHTALEWLGCSNNQLTTLDVSNNPLLALLYCNDNQFTTLDVSNNTTLIELKCYNNQLTTLDVSKNTALNWLECYNNQLISLNVSGCLDLKYLYCYRNNIQNTAMDALIASLPQFNHIPYPGVFLSNGTLYVYDNTEGNEGNVCTKAQVAAIKAKDWAPSYCVYTDVWGQSYWQAYEGSDDGATSVAWPTTEIVDINTPAYAISGQKVTGSLKGKKGVYIVGGKKVVIK